MKSGLLFIIVGALTVLAQYSPQQFADATKWVNDFRASLGNNDKICNDDIINQGAVVSSQIASQTKKPHGGFDAGGKFVSDKTGGKTFVNAKGQAWKLDPLAMVKQMCTPDTDPHCGVLKKGPKCFGIGTFAETTSIMYSDDCDCSRGGGSNRAAAGSTGSGVPAPGGTPSVDPAKSSPTPLTSAGSKPVAAPVAGSPPAPAAKSAGGQQKVGDCVVVYV